MNILSMPTVNRKATAVNIRRLMDKAGISVADVQEAMMFEYPQAIYKWLQGRNLPSLDNMVILAHLLHVTVDEIVILEGGER